MTIPIHIVHIIPTLRFGGAERMVVNLANHADRKKFRHTIVVLSDDVPLASELLRDVEYRVVKKKGKISWHLFGDLRHVLQELKPNAVHTHLSGGDIWGRYAAYRLGLPVVTTEHNMTRDLPGSILFVKHCLRRLSAVYVACSDAVKRSLIRTYRLPEEKIVVIRNGIDVAAFEGMPLRQPGSVTEFLMLGRLAQQKGHTVALLALSTLKEKSWRLTIVGDGLLKAELVALVEKYGLTDRVVFQSSTHDVAAVFARADILLMPSRWEGLGVVAMEAMAAGKAVVASHIDGLKEIITDEKTGYLVRPGDSTALAKRIEWCMDHPGDVAHVATRAREYATAHFGIEKMVKEYEKVYAKILASKDNQHHVGR